MLVWRLTKKEHASDVLKGAGGVRRSGRWHSAPRPVVYAASSLSLAALEVLAQFDAHEYAPQLVSVAIRIPDQVSRRELNEEALPSDWRLIPPPPALGEIGNQWLEKGASALLFLPSVIIPGERNLLINPRHPDCLKLRVLQAKPFTFDPHLTCSMRKPHNAASLEGGFAVGNP